MWNVYLPYIIQNFNWQPLLIVTENQNISGEMEGNDDTAICLAHPKASWASSAFYIIDVKALQNASIKIAEPGAFSKSFTLRIEAAISTNQCTEGGFSDITLRIPNLVFNSFQSATYNEIHKYFVSTSSKDWKTLHKPCQ